MEFKRIISKTIIYSHFLCLMTTQKCHTKRHYSIKKTKVSFHAHKRVIKAVQMSKFYMNYMSHIFAKLKKTYDMKFSWEKEIRTLLKFVKMHVTHVTI